MQSLDAVAMSRGTLKFVTTIKSCIAPLVQCCESEAGSSRQSVRMVPADQSLPRRNFRVVASDLASGGATGLLAATPLESVGRLRLALVCIDNVQRSIMPKAAAIAVLGDVELLGALATGPKLGGGEVLLRQLLASVVFCHLQRECALLGERMG